jgi:hypothetical protein
MRLADRFSNAVPSFFYRYLDCTRAHAHAGNPMWKKQKASGSLPHLSRWFDHVAALPECVAAVEVRDCDIGI